MWNLEIHWDNKRFWSIITAIRSWNQKRFCVLSLGKCVKSHGFVDWFAWGGSLRLPPLWR